MEQFQTEVKQLQTQMKQLKVNTHTLPQAYVTCKQPQLCQTIVILLSCLVKESLAASRHVTERSVARWRNVAAHTTEPAGVLLKSNARPANTFPQLAVCVNINIVILQISVPLNSTTPCKYLILH